MMRLIIMAIAIITLLVPQRAAGLHVAGMKLPTAAQSTKAQPAKKAQTATAAPAEQTLLELLNKERTSRGLAPVTMDAQLTSLARMKSQDMVAKKYFGHNSPTYGTPAQMLSRNGVTYKQYAENIAQGSDAHRIHAMWMASTGHRANMLNPGLTHVGIGLAGAAASYTGTQLFIAR